MDISSYKRYLSGETMMGPNSVRILSELLDRHPLQFAADDLILDLGCGTGLTSLVLAKETGAKVYANDLWVSAEENEKRFARWGIGGQVMPVCEDANHLHFDLFMQTVPMLSIRGNKICRLFILPEYQAKGYGSKLMDLLEDMPLAILGALIAILFNGMPVWTIFAEQFAPGYAGSSTFTMTCLPGSLQLSNVAATEYLGTTLNAAPVMGIICGAALFVMCWTYGEWATKKAREREEKWTPMDNAMEAKKRDEVPEAWKGFLTVVVLLATIIIGNHLGVNATLTAIAAMLGCEL